MAAGRQKTIPASVFERLFSRDNSNSARRRPCNNARFAEERSIPRHGSGETRAHCHRDLDEVIGRNFVGIPVFSSAPGKAMFAAPKRAKRGPAKFRMLKAPDLDVSPRCSPTTCNSTCRPFQSASSLGLSFPIPRRRLHLPNSTIEVPQPSLHEVLGFTDTYSRPVRTTGAIRITLTKLAQVEPIFYLDPALRSFMRKTEGPPKKPRRHHALDRTLNSSMASCMNMANAASPFQHRI